MKSLFFPQDSRSHKTRDLPAAGDFFCIFDGVIVSLPLISIGKQANQELKIKIEISRKTRDFRDFKIDPARLASRVLRDMTVTVLAIGSVVVRKRTVERDFVTPEHSVTQLIIFTITTSVA